MLSISRGLSLLTLTLSCIALLAGCAGTTAADIATPNPSPTPGERTPTALQMVRFGGPSENHVAPLDVQTDQAEKVQHLFSALRALPAFVPQVTCPYDQGGGYLLTFRDSKGVVAQAIIPAGGCPKAQFSQSYGCHKLGISTMDQIAATMNVQPATLMRMAAFWDSATPGGPMAPSVPSSLVLPMSSCR
ncbi:MAG TPA: hypothetical protein VJO13_21910 [Ktedonobacterales bacterium]|jgi:hypothetical protein|nr:hypothetical protein [Ktedonobacterales bacterium]